MGRPFVHPGRNEVAVLKEFENSFDGVVRNANDSTPANEALAVAGIGFLADAATSKRVHDALFLANHPARKGIDSPHGSGRLHPLRAGPAGPRRDHSRRRRPHGLPGARAERGRRGGRENHLDGHSGRPVLFPGVRDRTGTMPVAELLAISAIDDVRVIGGPPATPSALIDTRDFVRPQWEHGRLVLIATPAPGGHIAPFEVPTRPPAAPITDAAPPRARSWRRPGPR
ncbi:hypothetical protein [Actinoplanes sp. NPDC051411]|uniref:hypothetical protein n=1 Tax=Actinoplanes sp. NPDC051411 TaxID=3155522 RepID=UPI003430AB62